MPKIDLDGNTCLWWAVLLLLLPLKWLLCAAFAALVHELCHYIVIRLLGGGVVSITLHPGGAVLATTPMEPWRELLCSLAGPAGSLLLVCFSQIAPLIALCALVQLLFNVLPVFPLDGGRVLRCAAMLIRPEKAPEPILRMAKAGCLGLLLAAAIFVIGRYSLGPGAFLPFVILAIKVFPRKRPCKTSALGLQ